MQKTFITILALFVFSINNSFAQSSTDKKHPAPSALYDTILHLDSMLFKAFNEKNTAAFSAFLSKDLEFYHDKTGVTDYAHNVAVFKENFSRSGDLHRMLIKENMEVYPIPNYGAVQIAAHRFCHTENGQQDCGTFKFIHIWKRTAEGWVITRIISVDH